MGNRRECAVDGIRKHGRHISNRCRHLPVIQLQEKTISTENGCPNAQGEDVVAGIRTPNPINEVGKSEHTMHLAFP